MDDYTLGIRRQKLSQYVSNEFQAMINNEIQKYKEDMEHLSFSIDKDKWQVKTMTPTVYDVGGWYQHEEEEEIAHVSVKGRVFINGAPKGTIQTVNFTPTTGFYGLEKVVQSARENENDARFGGPEEKFKLARIMHERYKDEDEDIDYRVETAVEILTDMNMSKKYAKDTVAKVMRENPELTEPDEIVSKCMEITC